MQKADQAFRDQGNAYCRHVSEETGFPALYFSHPIEEPEELEQK